MSAYFITATGTDIGKTFVAAGLIRDLRARGNNVHALKPVVSGYDPVSAASSDPGILLDALGQPVTAENVARIAPWRYKAPLSPDMAAARENTALDFRAVVDFCAAAVAAKTGTLFIEGVGGVMVPLDDRHTVLDWMAELRLPLILVAGSYLGALSHTLTALDAVKKRGLAVAAIVVNETPGSPVPLDDTAQTLQRFSDAAPFFSLPRAGDQSALSSLAGMLSAFT
jgi:dethiobiotin synthetase